LGWTPKCVNGNQDPELVPSFFLLTSELQYLFIERRTMTDWQVISPEETAHSAIAPLGIWGWPYLFCKRTTNPVTGEGRVWLGIAKDNKMISGSHWKWNMEWKVMMDGSDVLTDVAPAVGAAWGFPVVFVRRKTDGAIFYSTYKSSHATPWQKLSGTTDRALAATGVFFVDKMHLFAFCKGIDNKVYYTRTSDSGDTKTWSQWAPISNFETDRAPASRFD
jgi:hypothetical protein